MWKDVTEAYNIFVHDLADSRTSEWPLVYSPLWPIGVGIIYNLFCWNSRKITSSLPAYGMRKVIVLYNFVMILLSSYMTLEGFHAFYKSGKELTCHPVDYSDHPLAVRMAKVIWWYYISKYIELIETVFFALRKKYNQISLLHVYHHTSMLCIAWIGIKYVAGGQSWGRSGDLLRKYQQQAQMVQIEAILFVITNSFVHAIMYTYYGLSAVGPHMQKYLWWKKYITVIQLSQFITLALYGINNIKMGCDFPTWLLKVTFVYAITLIVLFLNFFYKTYWNKKNVCTEEVQNDVPGKLKTNKQHSNGGKPKKIESGLQCDTVPRKLWREKNLSAFL